VILHAKMAKLIYNGILLAHRRGSPKFLLCETELRAGMRAIPGLGLV